LKKLALLAMFVVMGLAFAAPQAPGYILDQYNKADCMYNVAGGMAESVDYFAGCGDGVNDVGINADGGCPGEELHSEMGYAWMDLLIYMDNQNYPMVAQQYAYIVSLYSEMKGMYLQYGIAYVLEYEPRAMGELMGSFASYQGSVLSCFSRSPK